MLSRLSLNTSHRLLSSTNRVVEKTSMNRCLHLVCTGRNIAFKNNSILDLRKLSNRLVILPVRHESTTNPPPETNLLDQIPDPPVPPPTVETIVETVVKLHPSGEPTLASLGLCNYTGTGLIEKSLELLHINCNLPWWAAIVVLTVCVRTIVFPLVIMSQKTNAALNNYAPQMQEIQLKMTEARRCGNEYEATLCAHELSTFYKEKKINPFKSMALSFLQAPIFISCFFALRKMANLPVESLKDGGLWWFVDLTIPDPYYLLPTITSLTLFLTLEVSLNPAATSMTPLLKYGMRAVPFVIFPFMINFPGAVLCYWTTTNFLTLLQTIFLKWEPIRKALNIPALIKHDKSKLSAHNKGFKNSIKESWTNMKIARDLEDRNHADATQFHSAGKGPIQRTYKYDPTKQARDVTTILTKRK